MLSQFFILRINATSAFVASFSSFQEPEYSGSMHKYASFLSKKSYHLALLRPGLLFEIVNLSVFGAFANTMRWIFGQKLESNRLSIYKEIGLHSIDGGETTMNFCSNSIRSPM